MEKILPLRYCHDTKSVEEFESICDSQRIIVDLFTREPAYIDQIGEIFTASKYDITPDGLIYMSEIGIADEDSVLLDEIEMKEFLIINRKVKDEASNKIY